MFKKLGCMSLTLWALAGTAVYAAPESTLAVVNGKAITQKNYEHYLKIRAEQTGTEAMPDEQTIVEELVNRELVVQDALAKKLDAEPIFIEKLAEIRESLLAAMGIQNYLTEHPLEDAVLKTEYDKQVAEIELPKEYKVRHILVATEEDAKAIIAELEGGKDFAEIAKEKSTDSASATAGGDLGWINRNQVVPAFGEAIASLEKGKLSSPVKTQFGWHLIQVDEVRNSPLPAFDSVKEKLRSAMQSQQMQKYVDELRVKAKIEISKKDGSVVPADAAVVPKSETKAEPEASESAKTDSAAPVETKSESTSEPPTPATTVEPTTKSQ